MLVTPALTSQGAWLTQLTVNHQRSGSPHFVTALATTAVPDDPAEALRGGLISPSLWDVKLGPFRLDPRVGYAREWAGKIARKTANGQQNSLFLTWARPIFEQGALSPMSVLPADFPILDSPSAGGTTATTANRPQQPKLTINKILPATPTQI